MSGMTNGTIGYKDAREKFGIAIRVAVPDDAAAIAGIYRHYVETSAITFEYIAPDSDEMRSRMLNTLELYPYFVAEWEGRVVGFAYAGPLRSRPAYAWSSETTVYIAPHERGTGIGRALYQALEKALARMGILSAYACVTCPDPDGAFVTDASLMFHERMGYTTVGGISRLRQQVRPVVQRCMDEEGLGAACGSPKSRDSFF